MIVPEIWQSESFAQLSILAKLVFIGLFSNADDEGRGIANPVYIKSILFPYDDGMRVIDIEKALSEIGQFMSVTLYTHDGRKYYALDNWKKSQTIDRPKPSKLPPPTDEKSISDELPKDRRQVDDLSPPKKKGKEEEEKEKFQQFVATKYKELLDKGLEIKVGDHTDAFVIQPKDGGYQVAFSEKLFETFFNQYMRSFTKSLLYK